MIVVGNQSIATPLVVTRLTHRYCCSVALESMQVSVGVRIPNVDDTVLTTTCLYIVCAHNYTSKLGNTVELEPTQIQCYYIIILTYMYIHQSPNKEL